MKILEGDPLVYVVIVTWNSIRQIEYCLPTVTDTDYSNYKILMVDNHSGDGSVDYVQKNFPQIEVIENRKNRGYTGGNNDGIKHALAFGAEYIAILNPDVKVDHRWLGEAVLAMQDLPLVGILGFNVIGGDYEEANQDELFEAAKAQYSGLIFSPIGPYGVLAGMALFIRAGLFRDIGLFDERYFCYGEELDLERRACRAGYQLRRINVPLWHEGEGSFCAMPVKKSYLSMRNTMRYGLKNLSFGGMFNILRFLFRASCAKVEPDMRYYHHRRLRPSKNRLVNAALLSVVLLWNIIYLLQTIFARLRDNRRISQVKKYALFGKN